MHHLGGVPLRNMVAVEFEADLDRIVDLTDSAICEGLGIEQEDLLEDTHAVPQSVAKRLRRKGIQAILVPSVRDPNGKNRQTRETLIE